MRCMSFGLENCDKKDGSYTFSDLLKYNFYLPFFFFGPIMTFDRYHVEVRIQSWIWRQINKGEKLGALDSLKQCFQMLSCEQKDLEAYFEKL